MNYIQGTTVSTVDGSANLLIARAKTVECNYQSISLLPTTWAYNILSNIIL